MKKRIIKTGIVVVALFLAYNIFWFAGTHLRYNKYTQGLSREYIGTYTHFADDKDPYNYGVSLPGWLHYEGSLSVNHNDKNIVLFIWPHVFGDKMEYGIQIQSDDENETAEIMIDKDGNVSKEEEYSDREIKQYEEILHKNHDDINDLLKKANDEFKIGFKTD